LSAPKANSSSSITSASTAPNSGYYYIDAEEGRWNAAAKPTTTAIAPVLEGLLPRPPTDHYRDLRAEMVQVMQSCGLVIECHHHEVASAA
jgi:glutamine synthetase